MKSVEDYYLDSMNEYPAEVIELFCKMHNLFLVIHGGKIEKIVDGQEAVICERVDC